MAGQDFIGVGAPCWVASGQGLPPDTVPRKWVPGYRHHFTTWDRKPPSCDPLLRLRRLRTPWGATKSGSYDAHLLPAVAVPVEGFTRAHAWLLGGRRTPSVGQSTGVGPAA